MTANDDLPDTINKTIVLMLDHLDNYLSCSIIATRSMSMTETIVASRTRRHSRFQPISRRTIGRGEGKELLGSMLQTKELPQVLIMLIPSDRKLLFHWLYYYTKQWGAVGRKEWEERKVMGFVEDVIGIQLPQAIFLRDDTLMALSKKVKVKKALAICVALEEDESLENFTPRSAREREQDYDEVQT